jgi:hypothetical protein
VRRQRYLVLGVVAALTALVCCGGQDQNPATTGETPASSTSTTSTAGATTTTVAAPEGDALVVSEDFVLGWWADGAWQQDAEYRSLEAGAEFQIFSVGEDPYSVVGGEPVIACELAHDDSMRQIPLVLPPTSQFGRIGVSSPWAVKSGEIGQHEADQSLVDITVGLLADVGIDEENPVFAQVIESDLDGDGEHETVAVLDRDAAILGADDAYGVAFVVYHDGSVQVIGEYALLELPSSNGNESEIVERIVAKYRVAALMDINNDRKVEVAMSLIWWETWSVELFAIDSGTSQLTRVLGQRCGV